MVKNEIKLTKVSVKLNKKTPKKYLKVGRHKVTRSFNIFEFNAEEMKQLDSDKGRAFLVTREAFEKKKLDKKEKK